KIAKERKDQKFKMRAYDTFPIRHWDRWLDDQQTHVAIQPLEAKAPAHDLLAGTKLVANGMGFAGHFSEGSREEIESAWTPDGSGIVFAVTTQRNVAAYAPYPYDLYVADTTGGEPRLLTHGEGSYGSPHFSPDGKTLFAT